MSDRTDTARAATGGRVMRARLLAGFALGLLLAACQPAAVRQADAAPADKPVHIDLGQPTTPSDTDALQLSICGQPLLLVLTRNGQATVLADDAADNAVQTLQGVHGKDLDLGVLFPLLGRSACHKAPGTSF